MRLRVLIAPSGFKESLSAEEVADCIASGVRRAVPDALVLKAPVPDGGEGFARTLVSVVGGELHDVTVTGPVGDPVTACFGVLSPDAAASTGPPGSAPEGAESPTHAQTVAVLEMAAAAGLRHVPRDRRDPLTTTTYGVGELISAALDHGVDRILLGCGDSGTNDGGAGMAQALGARLLDDQDRDLPPGGGALEHLATIDITDLDPRLSKVAIDVACNWTNVLVGPHGVARTFGPQKGADPATVDHLEQAMGTYADVLEAQLGVDVREAPGSGASGGLGAGLSAILGATLHPRFDVITQYLDFEQMLGGVDLVITAEGATDRGSARGKVPAMVCTRAAARDIPVLALAGTVGADVQEALDAGLDAYASILTRPCTLEEALEDARTSLISSAEQTMRILLLGRRLAWQEADAR